MGNLRPETFAAINAYWSEVFGCAPHELWRGGITIGTHGAPPLAGYPGVYVLAGRGTTRISAPDHLVGPVTARIASAGGAPRDALLQPDSWREWFGRAVTQVRGPSIHHYLDDPAALGDAPADDPTALEDDPAALAGAPAGGPAAPGGGTSPGGGRSAGVRLLTGDDDAERLDTLRAACEPREWSESGFAGEHALPPVLFGTFRDGGLAAAATLSEWRGRPSDVCVLTHPEHRRDGLATTLAAAASRHALERGGLARYRAAVTNKPSLAIAHRLGYQEYGRNLSVLLEL
jgi:GNAT superfamily N-acetyltransferase